MSKRSFKRRLGGFFKYLGTLIAAVLFFAVGVIFIFEKGPSPEIRDLFVVTVMQSSAAKPLAGLFLDKAQVDEIVAASTAQDEDLNSDPDIVVIDDNKSTSDDIIVEEVHGPTYSGYMMLVSDPSRVYVYALPKFGGKDGLKLQEIVASEGAVAGVNGGGYHDAGGTGTGTRPIGIVISRGVWRNGDKNDTYKVIGFDNDNKLVVGKMTGNDAINKGIRDALYWGPALIVNGKAVSVSGGGGLNPRTAIGQRADGTVLLLVIDGRQPNSMGASYKDLIGIMQSYGAVTAANLDGGYSTSMVYKGEILNHLRFSGERSIPTAILVEAR